MWHDSKEGDRRSDANLEHHDRHILLEFGFLILYYTPIYARYKASVGHKTLAPGACACSTPQDTMESSFPKNNLWIYPCLVQHVAVP